MQIFELVNTIMQIFAFGKEKMTINEKIFKIMKEKGLKQKGLANYLGVNETVISSWKKRGNSPPAEYIPKIAKYLNIKIITLFDDNDDLTEIEKELLDKYNILPNDKKELIITMIRGLAKDYEHKEFIKSQKQA